MNQILAKCSTMQNPKFLRNNSIIYWYMQDVCFIVNTNFLLTALHNLLTKQRVIYTPYILQEMSKISSRTQEGRFRRYK